MVDKYLLFNLEDEEARNLGEVISNPTCKKICNFLAEKEASQSDISSNLDLPLNTVDYNIKKLVRAGLVEKSKDHFWSEKGKKIEMYKIANKLIVISPKKSSNVYSKLKSVVPVVIISGLLTGFVSWYYKSGSVVQQVFDETSKSSSELLANTPTAGSGIASNIVQSSGNPWIWFAIGSLVAILGLVLWNWKRL